MMPNTALRFLLIALFSTTYCLAQDFSDSFEQGLINWSVLSGNYVLTAEAHSGIRAAVNPPGASGIVRIRRNNFNACVGTFTAWFKLRGSSVDSRMRICVNAAGNQWYGVWFDPPGTDNPMWAIERGVSPTAGIPLASGAVPPIGLNTWYKMTLRREGNGRLTASINDGYTLTVVDNVITQPGAFEIPAYQDANNYMIFDDVSAFNTSSACATAMSPRLDSTTGSYGFTSNRCSVDTSDTTFRFCNVGTGKLTLSASISGTDTAEWHVISPAAETLAAGQCGTYTVRYTPVRPYGVYRNVVLALQTNADNLTASSGRAGFILFGKRDTIAFSTFATALDFGNFSCPDSIRHEDIIVLNKSTIASARTQTITPGPFSFVDPAPHLVQHASLDTVHLVCAFHNVALLTDSIYTATVTFTDTCGVVQTVLLTAHYRAPIVQTTTQYDFGTLSCDSSKTVFITVHNAGTLATTFSVSNVSAPFFVGNTSNQNLDSGGSVIVPVVFSPTQAGTFVDTIFIAYELCGTRYLQVVLQGTKDSIGIAVANVQPNVIDFGTFCPGQTTKDTTFTLVNTSSAPIAFSIAATPPFVIAGTGVQPPLAVNERRTITLQFTETVDGVYTGNVFIRDSCGDSSNVELNARIAHPVLQVTQGLDFGGLTCAASRTQTLVITNTGTAPATLHVQPLSGAYNVTGPTSLVIPSGATDSTILQFAPTQPALFRDTVVLHVDECNTPDYRVALIGKKDSIGFSIAKLAAGDTLDFGNVCASQLPRDTTFEIDNNSTVQLPLTIIGSATFSVAGTGATSALDVGEHRVIAVRFFASDDGRYDGGILLRDSCGDVRIIHATATRITPDIQVPSFMDTTLCVTSPLIFHVPVWNLDSSPHTLAFTNATCTFAPPFVALPGGGTMTIDVTVPTSTTTTTFPIVATDECGSTRTLVLHFSTGKTPMGISLATSDTSARDGDTITVRVLLDAPQLLANGDVTTVHVTNEFTTLNLVSADAEGSPASFTCDYGGCNVAVTRASPASDPLLVTLRYQVLVGATLLPTIQLDSASSSSDCIAATTDGSVITIPVTAHGCELWTVSVHPFTTALQSIYPNPAAMGFLVTYAAVEELPVEIALTNALGEILRDIRLAPVKPGVRTAQISTDNLENGLYVLSLRCGATTDTRLIGVMR